VMDKWGKTIFYIFTDYSDYFGLSVDFLSHLYTPTLILYRDCFTACAMTD
ncbi:unnamed protein product, partial [marine sediment metagenome]